MRNLYNENKNNEIPSTYIILHYISYKIPSYDEN